ncbi:hypothetical protein EIP91_003491 [Steccherinum ochraceum]|uniref:C3H1-type domain-containing protein n=1 Tax=Steccherinum ochraceum TaxID=92696 RepID=A0A4R0RNN3_9APHY|nr:hypothetical protein EIP91_003491 [Steccherinum ochraceum]
MGSPTNAAMQSSSKPDATTLPKRLRDVFAVPSEAHPLYRTKLCRNFALGHCNYGDKCAYIHITPSQPQPSPQSPSRSLRPAVYPPPPYSEIQTGSPTIAPGAVPQVMTTTSSSAIPLDDNVSPSAPPCTPTCANGPLPPATGISSFLLLPSFNPTRASDESTRRPRKRVRAATTSGTNHYRTKPCRFFFSPGGCIKGDKCNFMHDPAVPWTPETARAAPRKLSFSGSSTCVSESSSQATPTQDYRDLPKDSASCSDRAKKEFYPISWRVIGGGVMMGGRRDVCQDFLRGYCPEGADCKFAHPDRYDDSQEVELAPVRTPMGFTFFDGINPVSPLYLNTPSTASSFGLVSPLSPTFDQQRAPFKTRKPRSFMLLPPPPRSDFQYNIHRVLDGSTLCERELPIPEEAQADTVASEDPQQAQPSSVPSPNKDRNLFAARSIVRPLSTPPALSGAMKVERLFAAESP